MASGIAIPITIQVYKGPNVARTEQLNQEQIKIGKIASNNIQIDDESVSRMHAMVEVSPTKEVSITDLGSTKGTFVNGQKITKQKLKPGDEVRIGDVKLVVTFEVAAAEPEEIAEADADEPIEAPAAPAAPVAPARPMPPIGGPPPRFAPPMPSPFGAAPAPAAPPPPAAFAVPPSYGQRAFVPVVPPHIAEQVEVRDGSRAVEVAALFEEAVLDVKHFDDPSGGQVTPATKGILGAAIGSLAALFLLFIISYVQVSREKAAYEEWEQHNSALAAMGKDKLDKPFVARESPIKDVAAVSFLVIGLGCMLLGLYRRANEMRDNEFSIGSDPLASFKVPSEELPVPRFPLVRSTGTDYEVLFTGKMTGDMQMAGKTIQLGELASSGQARPSSDIPGAFSMSMPQEARINIKLGDNTFNINSVAKPRTYPVPLTIDWGTQSYTGAVFAVIGLFMALMFSVPPDPKSLSLDAFMNDQRLAKFLVKPEEQKPEEIPDWLKKQKQENENAGGKRAKETEGKMGKKESNQKNKIFAIKGPPTNTDIKMAKEAAKDAALKAGVLGILRSGQMGAMASIFGKDSALGRDADDALGGLVGTEVGEAYGAGGFGLVGSGRGGGGTGEGTIGLGNLGTIGRGSGAPGGGMYGAKVGNLKARKAGAPEVVPGTAEVRGSLDKDLIRRIIRRHINEVKFCYESELTRKPDLQGRVMVQFTIAPTGQVAASIVQSSTMGNPPVEQCIANAVRRWEFPKPQGGIVVVTYPFVLKSAGE
jgi:TonB family protein